MVVHRVNNEDQDLRSHVSPKFKVSAGMVRALHQEMVEFLILGEVRKGVSRTATLDFWRADFGLLRRLVDRVSWEAVLKGKGVQEGWTFFKKEILKEQEQEQEQADLMC